MGLIPKPPLGYRLLEKGEVIRKDDLYFGTIRKWRTVVSSIGDSWDPQYYYPTARLVELTVEPELLWD